MPAKLCTHSSLTFDVLPHAEEAGFHRPDSKQRQADLKVKVKDEKDFESTYPAPLLLPEDDPAPGLSYPPQSLLSWAVAKTRNKFTAERKTLYVADLPTLSKDVSVMESWIQPITTAKTLKSGRKPVEDEAKPPQALDVREILEAFYHVLPVKKFATPLQFTSWNKH